MGNTGKCVFVPRPLHIRAPHCHISAMSTADDLVANAPYGRIEQLTPLIRRVLAKNPSPFTYIGTGTYIIGGGDTVAVIDPGPAEPAHIAALIDAVAGKTVSHIAITHTHMDHSPAAPALAAATGARITGCAPLVLADDGPRADAGFDATYAPDAVMADGDSISGPDWTLTALHTPGHTSNHLCFALAQEKALFTGDHVMKWSTSVVSPPDGDMAAYMESLQKLYDREDRIYYPAHGPAVENPRQLVRGMIGHRRQRERQILNLLENGEGHIPAMVAAMYKGLDPRLTGAAGRSVLAHLVDLQNRGEAQVAGDRWQRIGGAATA